MLSSEDSKSLGGTLTGQATLLGELLAEATEPAFLELGLTPSSFQLLSAVHAAKGNTSQAEIARRLGIKPPSLTEAIKLAMKQGFVEQAASDKDQRSKRVRLSNKGKQALQRALIAISNLESAAIDGIDEKKLKLALEVLREANFRLAKKSAFLTQ